MSKTGFSTLNRWLGRKNKDKSGVNGKLSKSSTNLSISSTNINETSQLEYNRITPLPAATTNAPFEQTFRITVLLPKDQLYVTRLGARVPLSKLLELVCDNKLLDAEKYEFRNPVDPSLVYSCDLTIGAVGLSEIRLCHKSESYDNFNSDEIIKLHRTSLIRESLSSSEFSSRNSKHTTKTTSPYSSTNSLNSMDSSAVSYGRTPKVPSTTQPKMSAPPRKKRAAPRPPSQTAIPEKSALIMENGVGGKDPSSPPKSPLATKDFSVSSPNLTSSTMLVHSDINGNDCNGHMEDLNDMSSGNGSLNSHGYGEDTVVYAQVQKKNALNRNSVSAEGLVETEDDINNKLPEPSPRKRIVQVKKKTAAPPAPPPRNSLYLEDNVSLASTNVSSCSTPTTPMGVSKSLENLEDHNENEQDAPNINNIPTPVPRITTTTTLLNATDIEQDLNNFARDSEEAKTKPNISKVLLNRTPTPEPRSLSCEPPEIDHCYESQMKQFKQQRTEEDCVSKQADSGIGEPVPSPIPDSLTSTVSTLDVKSNFESSSDDDDMIKVYNFKLGKTLVKPVKETKTLEELTVMNNGQEETDSEISTSLTVTQVPTPNNLSETSSWNFAMPISPPPNFADNKFVENLPPENTPDTPITPKIMERPVLNFEVLKQEHEEQEEIKMEIKEIRPENSTKTPLTPMDNIMDELSSIIQDKGVESLMKRTDDPHEIESAKPNTLANFSINSIGQANVLKPKEVSKEYSTQEDSLTEPDFVKSSSTLSSSSSTPDEEKLYRKRSSVSSLKQRRSVSRSDSFHTTAAPLECISSTKRTSSQLSLDQMAGNLNRRCSSSELSIGESPSLQSLEVIRTILNSRKNSLANSSTEEDKEIEVNARRPSDELKFASLELKTVKTHDKSENELNMQQVKQDEHIEKNELTKTEENHEQPKELPRIYRYSGPPSINFSTWSERPKSQVAIKNEGDYIFGGGNRPPPVAPKPGTIQRMGIPEKDYKVPVLVKPIKDVIIDKTPETQNYENYEIQLRKTDVKLGQSITANTPRPTVETMLRPTSQIIVTNNIKAFSRNTQRPTVEAVLRPQTQTIVNTSTLPRPNKQRFSTPGTQILRSNSNSKQQEENENEINCSPGRQILRSSSIKQQQESEIVSNNVPGPQILRSSSIKQQQESSSPSETINPAPFGQNTLRRTGFKEKFLAKEEQEKQKAINVQTSPTTLSTPAPMQQKLLQNGDLKLTNQKFNNSITSAKLHLNLKKTNTSITTITTNRGFNTASPSFCSSIETSAFKLKPPTPQTAPVLSLSTPPPPPPPGMSMRLKPATQVRTPTESDDPRDELLAAIRNFKIEGLKRA